MGTQLKNYKEKNSYENLPLSFDVLQSTHMAGAPTQTQTQTSEQRTEKQYTPNNHKCTDTQISYGLQFIEPFIELKINARHIFFFQLTFFLLVKLHNSRDYCFNWWGGVI